MTSERVTAIVSGRVQGVSFRAYTVRTAVSLGLAGTVRNLMTGQVEIVAEGPRSTLEQLINWAQDGPPAARVESVDATYSPATGECEGFRAVVE